MYGHSCYGGHGKRADIPAQNLIHSDEDELSQKEVAVSIYMNEK